jgi:hypothetical protein
MTALDDVNGTICSMLRYDQPLEITFDGNVGPSISCLTHGQCIGLAVSSSWPINLRLELIQYTANSRSVVH